MKKVHIYSNHERANFAFKWCYPGVIMPEPYTKEDSKEACEMAVSHFLSHIQDALPNHPIKRMYKTQKAIFKAFNLLYPSVVSYQPLETEADKQRIDKADKKRQRKQNKKSS